LTGWHINIILAITKSDIKHQLAVITHHRVEYVTRDVSIVGKERTSCSASDVIPLFFY
jgi:hypothetical protein